MGHDLSPPQPRVMTALLPVQVQTPHLQLSSPLLQARGADKPGLPPCPAPSRRPDNTALTLLIVGYPGPTAGGAGREERGPRAWSWAAAPTKGRCAPARRQSRGSGALSRQWGHENSQLRSSPEEERLSSEHSRSKFQPKGTESTVGAPSLEQPEDGSSRITATSGTDPPASAARGSHGESSWGTAAVEDCPGDPAVPVTWTRPAQASALSTPTAPLAGRPLEEASRGVRLRRREATEQSESLGLAWGTGGAEPALIRPRH